MHTACPGLNCQNGGSMDITDCSCECTALYTGASCETCKFNFGWIMAIPAVCF